MGVELEIEGFEAVTKRFHALEKGSQTRVLSPALKEGAKVVHKKSKELAPVGKKIKGNKKYKPGRLKKSLKVKKGKRSRRFVAWYIQTGTRDKLGIPRDESSYYPMSLEYGTRYMKARPYLRPALKLTRTPAMRAVGKEMNLRIIKEIKKIKEKAAKKALR